VREEFGIPKHPNRVRERTRLASANVIRIR